MTTQRQMLWLVTGASQGFGRALTLEALRRGDEVIAVVRNAADVQDIGAEHPTLLTVVEADLLSAGDVEMLTELLHNRPIDVLVNNAGRAICGAAESLTMAQLREQLELNFFAAAALTRAALPGMRARRMGTIVQLSSQGGRRSFAGVGAYSASKFALEGWSEALAAEVAPLGIRVVLVEPSRFRTGFNTDHSLALVETADAYADTVGGVQRQLAEADGVQEGDPVRAARIIADLARSEDVPLRLPLGAEAVSTLIAAYTEAIDSVRAYETVARSADFPSEGA